MRHWQTTNFPTLEITTNIAAKGCVVDCAFCPQRTLEKAPYMGDRVLSLDNFKMFVDKVPKEVRITFAGFTEPFLNKHCTDMVLYASKEHPVSVFTTAVGMKPEDVYRLAEIEYAGNPNGGFCLHLPDAERIAKHPVNANYLAVIDAFYEVHAGIKNFYTMCMGTIHPAVKDVFPNAVIPAFWNRAGNLDKELSIKPEYNLIANRVLRATVKDTPQTCGCVEGLYHNVLLPNGQVSLCCMDYALENIIGDLYEQSYDEVVPKYKACFEICKRCENGIDP
jgi:hypothetical protein